MSSALPRSLAPLALLALASACGGGGGGTAASPAPAQAPTLTQNLPAKTVVPYGTPVNLTWSATGSDPLTVTLDGATLSKAGSRALTPLRRQTSLLQATNPEGSAQASFTLVAQGLDWLCGGGSANQGWKDGQGAEVRMNAPMGVVVDPSGNAFVADWSNHVIRKITPEGAVTTIAGQPGVALEQDGLGSSVACFNGPRGIARDAQGRLFVADGEGRTLRMLTETRPGVWMVTTLMGNPASNPDAYQDGPLTSATARFPIGIAVSPDGNTVFFTEYNGHALRVIDRVSHLVATIAGGSPGFADGTGGGAQFQYPQGLALDTHGAADFTGWDLYVADAFNGLVRKAKGPSLAAGVVGPWTVSTFSGTPGARGFSDAGQGRYQTPIGLALDAARGCLWVTDFDNNALRRVDLATQAVATLSRGSLDTSAVEPAPGRFSTDPTAPGAGRLSRPAYAAVSATGDLWVTHANGVMQATSPDGQ